MNSQPGSRENGVRETQHTRVDADPESPGALCPCRASPIFKAAYEHLKREFLAAEERLKAALSDAKSLEELNGRLRQENVELLEERSLWT